MFISVGAEIRRRIRTCAVVSALVLGAVIFLAAALGLLHPRVHVECAVHDLVLRFVNSAGL